MNTTYTNINLPFTFSNVSEYLEKFWSHEILVYKYRKVWFTVTIKTRNNKIVKLIDNLPFNTSDYSDLVIVLRQVFNAKHLSNRKDLLNSIYIEVYYEQEKKSFIRECLYLLCVIILPILTFLIVLFYVDIIELFHLDNTAKDILGRSSDVCTARPTSVVTATSVVLPNEKGEINTNIDNYLSLANPKPKGFIFKPLITVFDKSSLNNNYFPSYFLNSNLKVQAADDFNLLEYIIHNQYQILDGCMEAFFAFDAVMRNIQANLY